MNNSVALPEVPRNTDFGRRMVKLCPPGAKPPEETIVIGPIDVEEGLMLQQTGNGYGSVEDEHNDYVPISLATARRSEWISRC